MPRPQTFQPMRWACQPSQSSTPASSPCGISVSPLRGSFQQKLCAAACADPPQERRRRARRPWLPNCPTTSSTTKGPGAAQRSWGCCTPSKTGSCPPGPTLPNCLRDQHQQHHKGPGAAQRSARRAMGMLHPVQYNTQVKQAVAAGRNAQAPDVPANALGLPAEPEQHAGKQPLRDQRIAAARQFFNKNSTQRRCADPTERRLLHNSDQPIWEPGCCCPPGLHCRTAPAPAAPQRPRRSTALRAPGHGDAAPGAVQPK